jgi:hypothetical protein
MRKASESDAATQIRDETEKVVVQIRESDVTGEVRKGLIAGLEVLNRELGKLVERLEVTPQPSAPVSESAGPAETAEPVTEPAEGANPPAEPPSDPASATEA